MDLVRAVFGLALLVLIGMAILLGLVILCLLEARFIVRLTRELTVATAPACRATCDQ